MARKITEQLDDLVAGRLGVDQILAEGVEPYPMVSGWCPSDDALFRAFLALKSAYKAAQAKAKADAIAARTAAPVVLVKCACGHHVARSLVMHASLGTSCPDCYDRMSN